MEALLSKYDWRNLPMEIVANIREHIELYDDYETFLEVCSAWRLAIKNFPTQYVNTKNTQLPWLMLLDPDDSLYQRYYSPTKQMFLKIDRPRSLSPPQTRRYFSSQGWLICVSRNLDKCTDTDWYFNISIFNPFTNNNNVTIEAPLFHPIHEESVHWKDDLFASYFGKFVVSVSPTAKYDSDNFVVAMTYGRRRNLLYWRLGHNDDSWNIFPYTLGVENTLFQDLHFFRGELYATQCINQVIALGSLKDNNPQPRVVVDLRFPGVLYPIPVYKVGLGNNQYLVEPKSNESDEDNTSSTLLYICRYIDFGPYDENKYYTMMFKVFKLNVYNGEIEEVKSLGNQAIFVGFNSTFAVVVDDDCGCKADCIYYTNDYPYQFVGGRVDKGIYSLQTNRSVPVYEGPSRFSVINPPTWIEFCCT